MARAIIERVTCDKCGEVRHFEKLDNGSMTARLESLTEWLRSLGWCIEEEGLRSVDVCPQCHARLVKGK